MNDFSELENELKKLRPARPSPVLFARVEEAMAEDRRASAAAGARWSWRRLTETPYRFGIGLAAAAALLLVLARVNTEREQKQHDEVAQISPAPGTRSTLPAAPNLREGEPARRGDSGAEGSTASNKFIPAGATQVVYNARDEGLHFAGGWEQPLRRLRYQTRETWQWRNPATGASLRVSYPSEEVVLIPVSGQ